MPSNLQEFLSENSHRRFPLADTATALDGTGLFTIPDSLMLDMGLSIPYDTFPGTYYVSRMVVRRLTVDVVIGYKPPLTSAFEIGAFNNIQLSSQAMSLYYFTAYPQAIAGDPSVVYFSDMTGILTVGIVDENLMAPGEWSFTYLTAPLNPVVAKEGLNGIRSIQVQDTRYFNNVVLKEGSNVVITPTYDASTDTVTLEISARLDTSSSMSITDDASLLAALTSLYGAPVTSINNVSPGGTGNFTIAGADCMSLESETNQVTLRNGCSTPCCNKDEYLANAYDLLNQLNLKQGKLQEFYTNVTSAIEQVRSRISVLEGKANNSIVA